MAAPLVYPPNSIDYWRYFVWGWKAIFEPLRKAILALGAEAPADDEPNAIRGFYRIDGTDIALLSQFDTQKIEAIRDLSDEAIRLLDSMGSMFRENWTGTNIHPSDLRRSLSSLHFETDRYLSLPETSDHRQQSSLDTYALFRLCDAIDRGFHRTINGLANIPEAKAFGKLSGIHLDMDDLQAWNAAEEATKVWKQNTNWRHRVKAIAAQIRAEAEFTHPEEMLGKVDPFLRLVDPILGMGIALAELPDQTGTLKAITAGDETGEYRPNRPHLSLFDKLSPQLFPGVSFDKSEESAPLVLAATLERMAELEQVDSRGALESDAQADSAVGLPSDKGRGNSDKKTTEKRGTSNGNAKARIVAYLTYHHKYDGRSCGNLKPIGSNELAEALYISGSTTSKFFKDNFAKYSVYANQICGDPGKLVHSLQMLNGELPPYLLVKSDPAYRDDEKEKD